MKALYVGTQEYLNQKEYFHFKKYRKKSTYMHYKQFQIDPAIFTSVHLDCQHCHAVHPISCCEQGKPYSMTKEAEARLAKHAYSIILKHLEEHKIKDAAQHGYTELDRESSISSIKQCQGDCFFYQQDSNSAYCAIHRYAEERHLNPLHYKPFSCTLFPLDIIEENGSIFITALTQETESFSRWGTSYKEYLCINKSLRENTNVEKDIFDLDGYKPAWEWNRHLLIDSFGEELIEAIQSMAK